MHFTDVDSIQTLYGTFAERHALARQRLGRGLTYTEKVLFSHLDALATADVSRGTATAWLRPDRVAMQDATAQMALLQFMSAGVARVQVPTTVHCDHLIRAHVGADADLVAANDENAEVYLFLRTAAQKYGIGFWKPGSGIIHQVVLEHYAFPGGLMIGTDSHTPNAGGLGMVAIGVGGADAVDVMVGEPFGVAMPFLAGVRLKGKLNGWTSPKDVILKVAEILTCKGGTGKIVEYFGEGTASISCTGKATITNMGAELGATTSIFPYDPRMSTYLRATGRAEIADVADAHAAALRPDEEVLGDPARFFDEVIEIDLDTLEPHVVGPHTPDLARPVSRLGADAAANEYPTKLKAALVGSCTNSSYEDIERAAHVARQAAKLGLKAKAPLLITPGSEQIRATIQRDGQLADLEAIGGVVLANACGPCIGQWQRDDVGKGEKNSIITSFNRNFPRRNDGNPNTMAFIASPEVVTAYALAGTLAFDPLNDTLDAPDGKKVRLAPPSGDELPKRGFAGGPEVEAGYVAPADDSAKIEVIIKPDSERLEALAPFAAWDGEDLADMPVLLKSKGKTTTDHISPAGPWLKYRGHLSNISQNLFIGVTNAFTGEVGKGLDVVSGERGIDFWKIAKHYKEEGLPWIAVGDENWGEGSSREHAAMEPRFLGGRAILARSFARIHETNLKKQGMLPLTFADAGDYAAVRELDRVSVLGLATLTPGTPLEVVLIHSDGAEDRIQANHSFTADQIAWLKAGSSLNVIGARLRAAAAAAKKKKAKKA